MAALRATESFSLTRPDGSVVSVSAGQTAEEGAWVVEKNPGAFEPLRVDHAAEPAPEEKGEKDGVEEVLLRVADSYVQLLTPVRDDSPVAKYLDKKGEGIHHVAYRVDDCAAALERVKREGHQVIDEAPRPGSRGTTVAFVHPKTAFGTLIELVQE